MNPRSEAAAPRLYVALAFAAVYLIWGSTYLGIWYAIKTIPPFLMAGVRFLMAGGILYAWARWRGAAAPTRQHWRATLGVGALLLLVGNGGVTWAEQFVPSGLAALLVATVPLWMTVLDGFRPGGVRPSGWVWSGIAMGLAGIVLLVGPEQLMGGGRVDPLGAVVLSLAALSWAAGSLYARDATLPASPLLATGMEMLCGGALLLLAGMLTGELGRFDPGAVSLTSLAALAYLILFGAIIGFTAYIWLLGRVAPVLVSTYAYVNPVVAVLLGWWIASDPLTPRVLAAAVIIVAAVALITRRRQPTKPTPPATPPRPATATAPDRTPSPNGAPTLPAPAKEQCP